MRGMPLSDDTVTVTLNDDSTIKKLVIDAKGKDKEAVDALTKAIGDVDTARTARDTTAETTTATGEAARLAAQKARLEAEVAALLASCDLVCLPSRERTEAFGLVLLEAMRYAKPVVVSDIPGSGAPWLVDRAQNGILTPPGDAQALAAALAELRAHPARRQQLGQTGAQALQREFGIQPVARAITQLYGRVLEDSWR